MKDRKNEEGKAKFFNTQFIPLLMLMSTSSCILVFIRRAGVKFVGNTNKTEKTPEILKVLNNDKILKGSSLQLQTSTLS